MAALGARAQAARRAALLKQENSRDELAAAPGLRPARGRLPRRAALASALAAPPPLAPAPLGARQEARRATP